MDLIYNLYTLSTLKAANRCRQLFYKEPSPDPKYTPLASVSLNSFQKKRPYGAMPKLCYAPWTNIFFNIDGQALVCCKNTKIILGSYPKNSISEIWTSAQTQLLKTHILHNDLSYGCYKCKEAILQGNVKAMTSVCFDKYGMLPIKHYPRVMEFELSNKCNLECMMCSGRVSSQILKNRENGAPTAMHYDSTFVKQLEPFFYHLNEAKFYGGEPFIIDIYYEIWDLIFKIKPSLRIFAQSNATVLNDRIRRMIKKHSFIVSVSLDSLNRDNYEKIRKHADFDKVMANIAWLGKIQKKMTVIATPFRQNWKDIPDIVNFCNKNGYIFNISPVYHPEKLALWSLEKYELDEIYKYYTTISLNFKGWQSKQNAAVFNELVSAVKYWSSCKISNDSFNSYYAGFIAEQEKSIKTKIIITDNILNASEKKFFEALISLHVTDKEIASLKKIIKNYDDRYPLPKSIIYYYLQKTHTKETLVGIYRKSTLEELKEHIHNAYIKILAEYSYEGKP